MLDFSKYTLQQIMNTMLAKVTNALDKREGSIVYTVMAPIAYVFKEFYNNLKIVERDAYIETAIGDALDMIGAERGIYRKPAVAAVKKGLFNIEIDIGSVFVTLAGKNALSYEVIEYIGEEEPNFAYKLKCQTTGIVGNNYIGNIQAQNPITGLTYAYMSDIVSEGSDIETDESMRERYIESLQEKPFGGNIASYREAILAMDGVGGVQVWPFWNGPGTVKCSIITSSFEIATEELIKTVQKEICPPEGDNENPSPNGYGVAPIGAIATIATATELKVKISARLILTPTAELGTVTELIKADLETYFLNLRKQWDNRQNTYEIAYPVNIVHSQILNTIMLVPDVLDCRDLLINDSDQNISCVESGATQELPFLGEVQFVQS